MKNKKGVEIPLTLTFWIFAALLVLLTILIVVNKFTAIYAPVKVDCPNNIFWDGTDGLKNVLKEVDSGNYKQFWFNNKDCYLVSFSFIQGQTNQKISYPQPLPKQPMLCLCNIKDKVCQPYNCYNFNNYDQINTQQFSTEEYSQSTLLEFIKNDRTLNIQLTGSRKMNDAITYNPSDVYKPLDPSGLIKQLIVLFNVNDIKQFNPFVKVSDPGILVPEGIPSIEGFTKLFSIDLAQPPLYGQTIDDYITNHKIIDPATVKAASLTLSISQDSYQSLGDDQKEGITLYYKPGPTWQKSLMTCNETESNVDCTTAIEGFSNNFILSAESLGISEIASGVTPEDTDVTSCANFAAGTIPIPQDEKISCSSKVCCANTDIVSQLQKLRTSINNPDDYLVIISAARTAATQRLSYLDYLAGGYVAAGPKGVNSALLASQVPDMQGTKQQRIDFALKWLSENQPDKFTIVNDVNNFIGRSNHYYGKALDIRLKKMPALLASASNEDIIHLRNLMCGTGWANFGGEWWHYEYKTNSYYLAKSSNQCFWGNQKYAQAPATVTPNYA